MTTMSTYTQFGYPYAPTSQLLMSTSSGSSISSTAGNSSVVSTASPMGSSGGSGAGSTGSGAASPCCDSGRPLVSDPVTGQTVCSCQYDRLQALSAYGSAAAARLAAVSSGVYGAAYPSTEQNPYPSLGMDSTAFYSSLANPYSLKDGSATSDMSAAWSAGAGLQAAPGYYPYDPTFAAYGYGAGYDLAARRKNATRESTATLKAWLSEHKKNPYPTKGEKIMLAIITKMTLTQVSTWFANARRRLKKENKMTWEPKNRNDDDDDDDCSATSDDEGKIISKDQIKDEDHHDKDGDDDKSETDNDSRGPLSPRSVHSVHRPSGGSDVSNLNACQVSSSSGAAEVTAPGSVKPKIWSLADTAACKTPPPPPPSHHGSGNSNALTSASHSWFTGVNPVNPMVSSMASMAPVGHMAGNTMANMATMGKMGFGAYRYPGFPGYGSYSSASGSAYGIMANGCSPYAEVQTDTPPQTPPNLKMTSAVNGILGQHQQYVSPSSLPSRPGTNNMGPMSQDQAEMLSPVPRSSLMGSSSAASLAPPTAADPSSTAFRPVYRTSPVNGGYVSSS